MIHLAVPPEGQAQQLEKLESRQPHHTWHHHRAELPLPEKSNPGLRKIRLMVEPAKYSIQDLGSSRRRHFQMEKSGVRQLGLLAPVPRFTLFVTPYHSESIPRPVDRLVINIAGNITLMPHNSVCHRWSSHEIALPNFD